MARKAAKKKENAVPGGLNAGIVIEFVIFLVLQGCDVLSNYNVYLESKAAVDTYNELASLIRSSSTTTVRRGNRSLAPIGFCSNPSFKQNRTIELSQKYSKTLGLYLAFTIIATIIFSLHFLQWLATLVFSLTEGDFLQENWDVLVKGKIVFTLAASFLQDIPCSAVAIELYLLRRGTGGLTCWQCSMDSKCTSVDYLDTLLLPSNQALSLLILAITLTTLWKAVSSFFRWSRVDQCDMFFIRATTSLFAGFLYTTIIMTPAMAILNYRYYTLPGVTPGFIADVVDKLFIIGALFWSVGILTVCCCPLLRLIRLAQQ